MGDAKVQAKAKRESRMSSRKLIEMFKEDSRREKKEYNYSLPTKYNLWSTSEDNSFLKLTDRDYDVF